MIEQFIKTQFGNQYDSFSILEGIPHWYMSKDKIKQYPENVYFVTLNKGLNKITMVHDISRTIFVDRNNKILFDEYEEYPIMKEFEK